MSLLRQFQPQLQVISPAALEFQRAITKLPDPNEDPKKYRTAFTELNEKFADFLRMQVQVQLVEVSQQDPDEFMRVMPKIIDTIMPKLKSIEAKVDSVIDHRIYVETAYRHEIPIDALARAGVVIDSTAQEATRDQSAPEPQSPSGTDYSQPASPSALPTPPPRLSMAGRAPQAVVQQRVAALLNPMLTDAEVLS